MSTVTLYRDEECKDVIGSGFVGEYKTIYGYTPSVVVTATDIKFPDDETATAVYYLRDFGLSTINDKSESSDFNLDVTEESGHYDYAYFSSIFRMKYRIGKEGGHQYYSEFGPFQYLDNGQWKNIGSGNPEGQGNMYDPPIVSFRTLKTGAKYRIGTYPHYSDVVIDSENFIGVDITYVEIGQPSKTTRRCFIAVSRADKLFIAPDPEPYKPQTGNRGKKSTGTGYYPNSVIPNLPTAALNDALDSVLGRGSGLTYYKLTGSALEEVTECMYMPFNLNKHRPEAFASCILIPCAVNTEQNTRNIVYLADKSITINRGGTCNFVTRPLHEIDFGEINLTAENIGYTDFADITHTSAVLYLPCVGGINIDLAFMQGGQLKLEAVIDARNGNILYRLLSRASEDDLYVLYGQYSGNCGMPLAICGGSTGDIIGTVRGISSTMAGALSGNPLSFVAAGLGLASSITASVVDKSNLIQPACGVYGTNKPFLIISKAIKLAPPKYEEIIGRCSAGYDEDEKYLFGNFIGTGFFQASACHTDSVGATNKECEEIERLLLEGVFA